MNGRGYTIVQAGAEVPAEEFVRRYVDLADPAAGCRPCPDYGRYWTCPPYDVPAAEYWGRYRTVLLRGMQFHFTPAMLERRFTPEELAEYTRELTAAHARRMDEHLRALYPGAAVLTTGGCMLCAACTRPAGRLQSGISGLRRGRRRPGGAGLGAAVAPAGPAAPISDAAVRRAAVTYKIFANFQNSG